MEENLLGRSFKLVSQQLILPKLGRGERGRQLPQDLRCSGERHKNWSDDESETGFRGIVCLVKLKLISTRELLKHGEANNCRTLKKS